MRSKINFKYIIILVFWFTSYSVKAEEANLPTKQNVLVISNINNNHTELSKNTLRAMFTMHLQEWPNGTLVKVFVLEDKHKVHQLFAKNTLGFFPYQLRRNWDRLVFSGTGDAPTLVKSIQQMREKVAATKGSIGYIPSSYFDSSVKQIKVNRL